VRRVAGEIVRCPDTARTLKAIAAGGRDAFYKGELARRLIAYSQQQGGWFEADDLARHESEITEPLRVRYRAYTIHGQPPVSQGVILMEALALLDGFDLRGMDAVQRLHLMVEAVKCAFADRWAYLGDPRVVGNRAEQLLAPDYIRERRSRTRRWNARKPSTPPANCATRTQPTSASPTVTGMRFRSFRASITRSAAAWWWTASC
jgi:gamma-glutamyltranspeptidase / glutathione hydrolase